MNLACVRSAEITPIGGVGADNRRAELEGLLWCATAQVAGDGNGERGGNHRGGREYVHYLPPRLSHGGGPMRAADDPPPS